MGRNYIALNDHLIEELILNEKYKITELGQIFRLKGNDWVQTGLATTKKNCGIRYHHLKYKGRNLVVHRIVYRCFIGQLNPRRVVNHKDGNGLNNNIQNLELVTQSENIKHSYT
jgi:hypothetical protein